MGIEVTVGEVVRVGEGLWETRLSPREVRGLGACGTAVGAVSVVLLREFSFDGEQKAVSFSPNATTLLNVGNGNRVILIAAGSDAAPLGSATTLATGLVHATLGSGDSQFLRALKELPDGTRQAGEAILIQVRNHFPGDLRAVGARRFQETPDNFWFVTVQPRDQSLSITVRGLPDRFAGSKLKIVEDRRPYSRFKVRAMTEVPEAVAVIRRAIRKG